MLGTHTQENAFPWVCLHARPRTCLRSGFFCIYRMFDCLVVLGSGPLCLPVSLPCCLRITPCPVVHTSWLHTHRRGLRSGAISMWGGDQPIHFSRHQRGVQWTGGVSADQRQDAGVLQLSSLWWGTEGEQERTFPRSHSKSGQSWNEILITPQTWLFPPQSSADKQKTGTKMGLRGSWGRQGD